MRKSMSSASRMASFINQKSTCSHLDPYALILRHARWATNHSPHKYKMWERQRGAHIGMELLNSMELAIPRNVGKVVDLRSYLLEPIKDRSSLATIFSVHEVSHAKKTSKSIHPTLPIRNPSCGRLPPWSELILTGWPTFGVMHLVAVTLRAHGLMERHLDDIFAAQLARHSQAGGQANALDRWDSDCIAKSLSHLVSWLCNTWVLQMIYLDHSRST